MFWPMYAFSLEKHSAMVHMFKVELNNKLRHQTKITLKSKRGITGNKHISVADEQKVCILYCGTFSTVYHLKYH